MTETVLDIRITPTHCTLCAHPATTDLAGFPLCDRCQTAIEAPDDVCFGCGLPLTETEIEAEEVFCASCG